jgi:probable HAF family extracellular repeat protein
MKNVIFIFWFIFDMVCCSTYVHAEDMNIAFAVSSRPINYSAGIQTDEFSGFFYDFVDLGTLTTTRSPLRYSFAKAVDNQCSTVIGVSSPPSGAENHGILWISGTKSDLGAFVEPVDINDYGYIVGQQMETQPQSYIWRNGIKILLPGLSPNGLTQVNAINNQGYVVGGSLAADGQFHATFWGTSSTTVIQKDLGLLAEGSFSIARDINENGNYIVGVADAGGFQTAVFWDQDGVIHALPHLDAKYPSSSAEKITDTGKILGRSRTYDQSGQIHDYTVIWDWTTGDIQVIGDLGGRLIRAWDLNNKGEVVGELDCEGSCGTAFIWKNGQTMDLNTFIPYKPDWKITSAQDINDQGCIVGTALAPDGLPHAYILKPI